jgi:hypothetical protein
MQIDEFIAYMVKMPIALPHLMKSFRITYSKFTMQRSEQKMTIIATWNFSRREAETGAKSNHVMDRSSYQLFFVHDSTLQASKEDRGLYGSEFRLRSPLILTHSTIQITRFSYCAMRKHDTIFSDCQCIEIELDLSLTRLEKQYILTWNWEDKYVVHFTETFAFKKQFLTWNCICNASYFLHQRSSVPLHM